MRINTDESFVKQWEYDFKTFQQKCYHDLPIEDAVLKEFLRKRIKQAKEEVVHEREFIMRKKLQEKKEK